MLGEDHSAVPAGCLAGGAVDKAFEIVEVGAVSVTLPVALVEYRLDFQEQLLRDERLVATAVQLSLIPNDSRVIRVTQHLCQPTLGERCSRSLPRWTGREPVLFEKSTQLRNRVVAGGVLFECPCDQWSSMLVHFNGVDEVAVEVLPSVEVADLGASDAAALSDLVCHLDGDVLPTLTDLDLVHDVGNGFHRVAHIAITELLFGGDKANTFCEQFALCDGCIGEVAEHPRAHIDDDVADFGVLVYVL
ncbi:hypothetical protein N1032_15000 [Herbiconiux sp. CPCC 203386]|uniref:DUF1998 domain-containing protein n=1 Tax=Herbiconiux daphne TaxID=2970914 RepID=A0ABT2H546_9MICO|nr:hypothetical protein [Herbiconiux daphne]MCS5735051.1 hypothetical protein [Herbiconiux daphne]